MNTYDPLLFPLGFTPGAPSSAGGGFNLNSANARQAFSFVQDGTKTLSKIRTLVSGVAGNDALRKITCSVFANSANVPSGAVIASVENTGGFSAGAIIEWSGFSQSLTDGVKYWIVFSNTSVDPTADYVGIGTGGITLSGNNYDYIRKTSADGGSSWANTTTDVLGIQLEYSDGTSQGIIATTGGNDSFTVYGTRENGILFITPPSISLKVYGVIAYIRVGGTKVDGAIKIYAGTSLIAQSQSILAAEFAVAGYYLFKFTSIVKLEPYSQYRIRLAAPNSDGNSSNYIGLQSVTFDSTALTRSKFPFKGTMQKTTFDGSTIDDSIVSVLPCMGLMLGPNPNYDLYGAVTGVSRRPTFPWR